MPKPVYSEDTQTTVKGRELANRLAPAIGVSYEINQVCSLIARHARTYSHIQEMWCSVEMSDRRTRYWEHRESLLESRIRLLVAQLPLPVGTVQAIAVLFSGDPRGVVVKLVMPEPWTRLHDDWGREGVCVPGA